MKIVFFTGAGVSKESGISTFRDSDGMWNKYNVMQVATVTGWNMNRRLLLDFYNERRQELHTFHPNVMHEYISSLEDDHDITVITQNVDDLHERAGSTNVIHLHGKLDEVKCSNDSCDYVIDYFGDIIENLSMCPKCEKQLRPNVVLFGEYVPNMFTAIESINHADVLVIIGTSLEVEPAATLAEFDHLQRIIIDPSSIEIPGTFKIRETAVNSIETLSSMLKQIELESINNYRK